MYLQWKTHTRRRDAVAGSHHSWGAAYSSAHKRTKRACCTQEIAATQFTIVKQRWRTRSHTHSCTFIRTIILMHARAHRAVHTQARTHWCWLPLRLGLWTVQWGLFSAKWIAPLIPHHALCVGVCAAPPCELVRACHDCQTCVHVLCVCVGPSSFVWAQLRGESCFACGSASQTSCSGQIWSFWEAFKQLGLSLAFNFNPETRSAQPEPNVESVIVLKGHGCNDKMIASALSSCWVWPLCADVCLHCCCQIGHIAVYMFLI